MHVSTLVLLYFTHFHTCSLCRVELVVQFPARGSTQVLLCLFPGVLCLWHFLYSVGPHTVSSLHIYNFVVSRAFMAGAASQAGVADSSRAPGHTSGLQGPVNVNRCALLVVPRWQCISSFVFCNLIIHICQFGIHFIGPCVKMSLGFCFRFLISNWTIRMTFWNTCYVSTSLKKNLT